MAVSAVQFQFGSIVLSCLESNLRTEEQTDRGGVNVILSKEIVTARGFIVKGLAPVAGAETPSETFDRIKNTLMRHRRYFVYAPFGTTLIQIGDSANPDDPSLNQDDGNGPKCTAVRPISLNEAAIQIEVVVEVERVPCVTPGTDTVINHHFRYGESRDLQGYRSRTIEGVIRCRNRGMTAKEVMAAAGIPPVPPGYQQVEPSNYSWMDDGLTLVYNRTEQQYEMRPPDEAAGARIKTRIQTQPNNAAAYATISVELDGNIDVAYDSVVNRAQFIAFEIMVGIANPDSSTQIFPTVGYSIGGEKSRKNVVLVLTVLADLRKIQTLAGRIRNNIFSPVPTGMAPQGSSRYLIPADEGNDIELLRAPFQEPCEDLVEVDTDSSFKRRELTGSFRNIATDGILGLLGGTDAPTPGPVSGGGGTPQNITVFGPGAFAPPAPLPQSSDIAPFISLEQANALAGGNALSIAQAFGVQLPTQTGGLFPAQDFDGDSYPPSLMDQFQPGGIGGGPPVDELKNYSGNLIDNRGARTPTEQPDPPDDPSTYSVYLIDTTVSEDTGYRATGGSGKRSDGKRARPVIAQVHQGEAYLTVRWTCVRYGARPQIPDPSPGDPNYVLKSRTVRADQSVLSDSGHIKWTRTGSYTYIVQDLDRLSVVDVFPPFVLPVVKRAFPNGVPPEQPAAKDIIWWQVRKSPGDAKTFAPAEKQDIDLIYVNGQLVNRLVS